MARLSAIGLTAVLSAAAISPPAAADSARAVHTSVETAHACLVHDGAVLAATDGGLVSYGEDQTVWTALDKLPATRAHALYRTESGQLWIGTEHGAARIELNGGSLDVKASVKSDSVRAFAELDGALYAGTWGGGVVKIAGSRARAVPFSRRGTKRSRKTRARVTSLAVHDGVLYAATAGSGVYAVRRGRLVEHSKPLLRKIVWSIASAKGSLWAGTIDGLYELLPSGAALVSESDVRGLTVVGDELMAATFGDGVYRVRANRLLRSKSMPREALFSYSVSAGCVATHRGTWIENNGSWSRSEIADAPPSNDISALAVDGDRLWVGSFDRGLGYYESGKWTRISNRDIDDKINALAVTSDGELWIATAAGLSIYKDGDVRKLDMRDGLPTRHILSLHPTRSGAMLVGTTQGAVVLDGGRPMELGRKQGLSAGNIWDVHEDIDGNVWLATTRGLFRGRLETPDSFSRFSIADGALRDDWVMALESNGRTLWAGTYKGGVTKLSWSEGADIDDVEITQLGEGWINPGGLTYADGKLYASTMEGLLTGDGSSATWTSKRTAAPGKDTTAVAKLGDRLWVSSRRGLVAY